MPDFMALTGIAETQQTIFETRYSETETQERLQNQAYEEGV